MNCEDNMFRGINEIKWQNNFRSKLAWIRGVIRLNKANVNI